MPKKEDSSASKQGTKYFKVIEKKKAFRIRQNEAINLAIEYGDTNNPETLKWIINKMIKILAGEYYQDVMDTIDYKWSKGRKPRKKL